MLVLADLSVLVDVFILAFFTSDLLVLLFTVLVDRLDLVVLVVVACFVAVVVFVVLLVPQPANPNDAKIARDAVAITTFDAMFFYPFYLFCALAQNTIKKFSQNQLKRHSPQTLQCVNPQIRRPSSEKS